MEVSLAAFRKRYQYDAEKDLLNKYGSTELYKAWDIEVEQYVTLKIYTVNELKPYNLVNEIIQAKKLKHPILVEHLEVYEINTRTRDANGAAIVYEVGVTEYADNGSLAGLIKMRKRSPDELKELGQNIIDGLVYLHQHNVIHRYLRPDNILIFSDGERLKAKISDYGISISEEGRDFNGDVPDNQVPYSAPELLSQDAEGKYVVTNACDNWSFGVILYEAVTAETLFGKITGGETREHIINNILTKDCTAELEQLDSPWKELITYCLQREAVSRPNAASLKSMFGNMATGKPKPKKFQMIVDDEPKPKVTPAVTPESSATTGPKLKKSQLIVERQEDEVETAEQDIHSVQTQKVLRSKYILFSILGAIAVIITIGIIYFALPSLSPKKAPLTAQKVVEPVKSDPAPVTKTEVATTPTPPAETHSSVPSVTSAVERSAPNHTTYEEPVRDLKKQRDTMYCFVTIIFYYKDGAGNASSKDPSKLYHSYSNVFAVNCATAQTKAKVETYIEASFPKRTENFGSFKEVKAQVFKSLVTATKMEIPYKAPVKNAAGNFDFDVDETEINSSLCK